MKWRLGTRTSKMAMHQAKLVQALLIKQNPQCVIDIIPIRSEGDQALNKEVFAGKGVFIKKLDEALLQHEIDFAVNCMKDIPNDYERDARIGIAAVLPREDIRDALLLRAGCNVGTDCTLTIGTSAPRRRAVLQKLYPNAVLQELRGSCDTRVKKLDAGEVDALILSKAGLERIDLADRIHSVYPPEIFLPPLGAGIITMDTLKSNQAVRDLLQTINHSATYDEMLLERAFINTIHGDCHTPMGGYIYYADNQMHVQATVFSQDLCEAYQASVVAPMHTDPQELGVALAEKILVQQKS